MCFRSLGMPHNLCTVGKDTVYHKTEIIHILGTPYQQFSKFPPFPPQKEIMPMCLFWLMQWVIFGSNERLFCNLPCSLPITADEKHWNIRTAMNVSLTRGGSCAKLNEIPVGAWPGGARGKLRFGVVCHLSILLHPDWYSLSQNHRDS